MIKARRLTRRVLHVKYAREVNSKRDSSNDLRRWRYLETPPLSAVAKVMSSGGLVLATSVLIGSAG